MARLEEKFRARALGTAKSAPPPLPAFNPLTPPQATLTELPLEQIEPDPTQPRQDLGDLSDLKASIASVGLVQPIIVTILGYERYRLVAGERRFTAAQELNLPKIPAIVRTVEEHQRLEVQIVENLHRKDLNPFEEASSYQRLMTEFGLNQEAVGKRLGKSQGSISELLRLLDLPQEIQEEYRTSDKTAHPISKSLLLEIAKGPAAEQRLLWGQARQGALTVRKARARTKPAAPKPAIPKPVGDPTPDPVSAVETPTRYSIKTREAVVTVEFARAGATNAAIQAALLEAIALAVVGTGSSVSK